MKKNISPVYIIYPLRYLSRETIAIVKIQLLKLQHYLTHQNYGASYSIIMKIKTNIKNKNSIYNLKENVKKNKRWRLTNNATLKMFFFPLIYFENYSGKVEICKQSNKPKSTDLKI